jgi:ATP-dependent 26S proteasome regulatory subunit
MPGTPTTNPLRSAVASYLAAGFPALYITTHEETRAEKEIIAAAAENDRGVFKWSITRGWVGLDSTNHPNKARSNPKATDPLAALSAIEPPSERAASALPEENVFILSDFHPFFDSAEIVRKLRDLTVFCKGSGRTLIFVSPITRIPIELEKEITLVDFPLPSKDDLGQILDMIVKSVGVQKAAITDRGRLLEAAQGLIWAEAENAFSLALVKHKNLGDLSIGTVQHEKASIVKKSGVLEVVTSDITLDRVGGLNALKRYGMQRKNIFTEKARAYGLPPAKGVLLVGVQGCGKSLSAKAFGNLFQTAVLRLDFGSIYRGIVGESEQAMRHALRTVDAFGGCILWVDEIDKGASGAASSDRTDGGVTKRVIGTYLTWAQETRAPVYPIATCNDIDALLPEMIQRFDEVFFVDLPLEPERRDIFEIGLKEVNRDPKKFNLAKLAQQADQYSGREIKQVITAAMFSAFSEDREVADVDILQAIEEKPPLAVTNKDKVEAIRERARRDKWRVATEVVDKSAAARRIAVK